MSAFTLCLPYYENPGILARQIETWNSYDDEARAQISVALVDDGSPRNPALPVIKANPCKLKIRLWRVLENKPWNQHGARNLAARAVGGNPWLLMTDIDHLLEPEAALKVVRASLKPACHYTFDRVSLPDLLPYKAHCNTFLVTRDAYWKVGGYDEDYCGAYGGDGPFLRALGRLTPERRMAGVRVVRVPRDVMPDASTTEWPRVGEFKDAYRELHKAKNKRGDVKPVNPLRFTWERQL